jgi:P2-related tail formation protein
MTCDNGCCRYLTQLAHSFHVDEWGSKWSVIEADGNVDDADAVAVVDAADVTVVAVAVVLEAEYRE